MILSNIIYVIPIYSALLCRFGKAETARSVKRGVSVTNQSVFLNFDCFVLDATFHDSPLSETLLSELSEILNHPGDDSPHLYAASTFQEEYKELLVLLEKHAPAQAQLYSSNLEKLSLFNIHPRKFPEPRQDTWRLINQLCSKSPSARILVLTGNETLIERIVLAKLNVSIFHLPTGKVCLPDAFTEMGERFEFSHDDRKIEGMPRGKKPENLCDSAGKPLDLKCEEDMHGNEAKIFRIENREDRSFDGYLAKVYNQSTGDSRFSLAQAQNLAALKTKYNDCPILRPWLMLPTELVYIEDRDEDDNPCFSPDPARVAGHMMHEVTDPIPFTEDSRFHRNKSETDIAEKLEVCIALVRQNLFLNHHGLLITDWDEGNFATKMVDRTYINDVIYTLDTGSITFKNYQGVTRSRDMTPIYFPNPQNKRETISFNIEMTHLMVLKLLTGMHSIFPQEGRLPFLFPDNPCFGYRQWIPDNIWLLVKELYTNSDGAERLSLEILLVELRKALASLRHAKLICGSIKTHPHVTAEPEPEVLPWWSEPVIISSDRHFPRKTLPPFRSISLEQRPELHCSGSTQISTEPYPPAPIKPSRNARLRRRPWIIALLLILVLLAADMVHFAVTEFDFAPSAYLSDRMEPLSRLWQLLLEKLRLLFSTFRS